MHAAQCGCGGSATLVPYGQYPIPSIYSQRPDLHDFPTPSLLSQYPYYQAYWPGNQLPSTRWNGAGQLPFAVARADYFQQVQLARGAPPLSAPAGAVQSFVRRLSAAWSASYGR